MDIGEYASQDYGKTQRRRSVYTFRGDGAFWISDRRGGDVYSIRGWDHRPGVMEDKRKEPEKPEKPGKPEKPERPVPDDDRETEPETPDETETPETEPTEEPRKKGIITARYEIELDGRGELRISRPSRIRTKIPRAGDQQRPWVYGALAVLGILGGSIWSDPLESS